MLSSLPFEVPRDLLDRAVSREVKTMAIAGAESALALESARMAYEAGLIEPLLVGDADGIRFAAQKIGWDIGGFALIAARDEEDTAGKAVALARSGEAGALMKGGIHTEALMRAVVSRDTGLRGEGRMSHLFRMGFPGSDRSLLVTDAALNVAPDVEVRLAIARNAVGLAHHLGMARPRVAVLSAVETASQSMPSSLEAAEIEERAMAGEVEDALVAGPLSFDLAVSPEAAAVKGVDDGVAGSADILVVPNIETGNALFKAMVYLRSATAAGIVLGARVPIVLTSRADPPEARLAAAALAVIAGP